MGIIPKTVKSDDRSRGGNVAVMFALSLTATMGVAGFGVDMSRSVGAGVTLQSALDASALAAAVAMEDATLSTPEAAVRAVDYFHANLAGANSNLSCADPLVQINEDIGSVRVTGDCRLPATIASLLDIETLQVARQSVAKYTITHLDLALMLDVSGSMSGQKLADLKTAAKDAIDTLITPQSGDRVRIALNSYSTAINAGPYAQDVIGPTYNTLLPYADCVTERAGVHAFDEEEPGPGKFVGNAATSVTGKSTWCPATSIEPLTDNSAHLKTQIDALSANGWTAGHLGVAWSWYLISPEWDDVWPAASKPLDYTADDTIKAVILMTDGSFNTSYAPGQGDSVHQSKVLCKQMREDNIRVYSVAFQAPAAGKDVLEACAGVADRFFEAENGAELKMAYAKIASELTNLRLSE